MATCSVNPYHDIADKNKQSAIVKILALLKEEELTKESLIGRSGKGSSTEFLLNELMMYGLIQPSIKDGFVSLSDRGEYALNEME
ncbi:hypothetical protein JAG29_002984 [Citrobacter freundii]|uniref:hypothetical protein n=1 Tax=Citrobacter freundii TaxID=546 RepID=UPI0015C437F7|nr:hypothetical protein [Citrobacter freundii]EGT0654320.1 hypothetical protein [Citrobacter freundii]NWO35536.1 hypothetical protein [Citrobacter freundii]